MYTIQVNSAIHARRLASSEVISEVLSTSEQQRKTKMAFVGILSQKGLPFGSLVIQAYSACVVYTKTIIHLSVGESGGYLPSRELLIINNISPSFTM